MIQNNQRSGSCPSRLSGWLKVVQWERLEGTCTHLVYTLIGWRLLSPSAPSQPSIIFSFTPLVGCRSITFYRHNFKACIVPALIVELWVHASLREKNSWVTRGEDTEQIQMSPSAITVYFPKSFNASEIYPSLSIKVQRDGINAGISDPIGNPNIYYGVN